MRLLITGGTGRCGRAILDHLDRHFGSLESVRILTRSARSTAARRLSARGAELVEGDLLDRPSLHGLFDGVDRAFLITTPADGYDEESKAGEHFIGEAVDQGLPEMIFQSVLYADTTIPHCASKGVIERALRDSGLRAMVLRPGLFLDVMTPVLRSSDPVPSPIDPEVPGGWISIDDLGRASAAAFRAEASLPAQTFDLVHPRHASLRELADDHNRLNDGSLSFVFAPVSLARRVVERLGEERAARYLAAFELDALERDYYGAVNTGTLLGDPEPLLRHLDLRFAPLESAFEPPLAQPRA